MSATHDPTDELRTALGAPDAYPASISTSTVAIAETHISLVFLLDDDVFKVKKPLDLGFLDFSTLERREHFCREEVRLNRRLAPEVYRGVVPIVRRDGRIVVAGRDDGSEEPIEWAVHMTRLPDAARLADRLASQGPRDLELDRSFWDRLGARLAAFHAAAERSEEISAGAHFSIVAENARDNLTDTAPFITRDDRSIAPLGTISPILHAKLTRATERALAAHEESIEARAASGTPCDTHGDLRLDHVYHFPERTPPDDLVIIDCVEFSSRFRHADPISDAAFLSMDLRFAGEREAADRFDRAYLEASGDDGTLFPFYTAYRSAVRAKIDHLTLSHTTELSTEKRTRLEERALGHWLLALGLLEEPRDRPALVLVGGPPGCGNSTVAEGLAREAGFAWIRSDVVRKELFPDLAGRALYDEARVEAVYEECRRRADGLLREGGRALIDATFHREAPRAAAGELASIRRVPALFIELDIDRESAHARIRARHDDPSDADAAVHDQLVARWEACSAATRPIHTTVDASEGRAEVLDAALGRLRERGMLEPSLRD